MNDARWIRKGAWVVAVGLALVAVGTGVHAQMKQPNMTTLSGRVIDLTCSVKGHAMTGKWMNALYEDHMTPEGKKPSCATMCLKGGQPAALFDKAKSRITAVFACNPRATLADYASKDVEVQGFWASDKKEGLPSFVPQKIRLAKGGDWKAVDCATMHN